MVIAWSNQASSCHHGIYILSWLELSETGSPNEFYCDSTLNNNELSQLTASSIQESSEQSSSDVSTGLPKSQQILVLIKTL